MYFNIFKIFLKLFAMRTPYSFTNFHTWVTSTSPVKMGIYVEDSPAGLCAKSPDWLLYASGGPFERVA